MKQMMRNTLKCFMAIICFCQIIWPAELTYAKEYSGQKSSLDITFVVDASGSMRTNDPNRIALEMVKAFVDTVHTDEIRIGFVAYSDVIVSATSPVSMDESEKREWLKQQIDATNYSGNTDIGLGLVTAYEQMPEAEGRKRIVVLISDGETDLKGSQTGRDEAQSNQDTAQIVKSCQENKIPIYTIAFGQYSGSTEVLEQVAGETGAKMYTAQSPDLLIEVLYGILNNNLAYKIQQISAGTYAQGLQELSGMFDEPYLNEVDILLISPQKINSSLLYYGEQQVPMTTASYYAVGKIGNDLLDDGIRDLTISTATSDGQQMKVYVIGYRNLMPVLDIDSEVAKNKDIAYQVFFQDKAGKPIQDEAFYQRFDWSLYRDTQSNENTEEQPLITETQVTASGIQGVLRFRESDEYQVRGSLSDKLGNYQFVAGLTVRNTPPNGTLPVQNYHRLSGKEALSLDDYFLDADDDALIYRLETIGGDETAYVELNGSEMTIEPRKPGIYNYQLIVSDGEAEVAFHGSVLVRPLWQVYWWVIVIVLIVAVAILRKLLYRPRAEAETIENIVSRSRFNGRLDLYFTKLPDEDDDIPPLVFSMYKIRSSKIRLGDLLQDYSQEVQLFGLNEVYLIADEERKMILYHNTDATVMLGSSIICRKVRYSVSFGDVLYITTPDGNGELELHYISMIQ